MNELAKDSAVDSAVPVTILTGFLGAGKTTLLNRILTDQHGLQVAVLVNDFGAINVDADLVVGVEDEMISLANGCVCCQVRDDLIEAIDNVLALERPVEYILLEASGVADPASIYATFADPKYRDRIRVDSITCVVDAEQVYDPADAEAVTLLKLKQIGFADLLILNKTDLVDEAHLNQVRSWIDSHLSRVRVVESNHCNVPLEILLGVGRFDPARQQVPSDHQDHGNDFSRWSFETAEPLNLNALREMIKHSLSGGIYRCKGFMHTAEHPNQRCVLQVVGRRADITVDTPWGHRAPLTQIVAIGAPGELAPEVLQPLFESCIAGRERPTDSSLAGVRTVRI